MATHSSTSRFSRLHGIQAVRAVVDRGAVGPLGTHPAHDDVAPFVDLERIALGVFDGEVFDGEVAGGDQQALGTLNLALEGEDALVHASATNGDSVDIERQAACQLEGAGWNLDHVTGLGADEPGLQVLGELLGSHFDLGRTAGDQ